MIPLEPDNSMFKFLTTLISPSRRSSNSKDYVDRVSEFYESFCSSSPDSESSDSTLSESSYSQSALGSWFGSDFSDSASDDSLFATSSYSSLSWRFSSS